MAVRTLRRGDFWVWPRSLCELLRLGTMRCPQSIKWSESVLILEFLDWRPRWSNDSWDIFALIISFALMPSQTFSNYNARALWGCSCIPSSLWDWSRSLKLMSRPMASEPIPMFLIPDVESMWTISAVKIQATAQDGISEWNIPPLGKSLQKYKQATSLLANLSKHNRWYYKAMVPRSRQREVWVSWPLP